MVSNKNRLVLMQDDHRFPPMFENEGLYVSAGIAAALMVAFSIIPTIFLQWKGHTWRS